MNRFWSYDVRKNSYLPTKAEPLSAFPTILDLKQKLVFCRFHHQWERIAAFSHNVIKTSCGKLYTTPFVRDNSLFNYGYDVIRRGNIYYIRVQSQKVGTNKRQLLYINYEVNLDKKVLFKEGKPVFETEDITGMLAPELAKSITGEMSEEYKKQFGIRPTLASGLTGFSVVLGYMLSPFNVNFYRISQHWGLQPYDSNFTSLSSGDTPTAENEMFDSLGIKATKTARKLYQSYPEGIVAWAGMKDLGFSDVNLLKKSARKDFYLFFKYFLISFAQGNITYTIRDALRLFVQNMLAISDQKTVWNSLERTVKYFVKGNWSRWSSGHATIVQDALNMYPPCADHLTDREKKEIMREGFNDFTHDFLLRRNRILNPEAAPGLHTVHEANLEFPIEQAFLDLEYKCGEAWQINKATGKREAVPDEERWCFYVAKDSYKLKTIGSEMSNCVGWGYKNAVFARRATIVYAMYREQYKICIEVTPDFQIRQAYGPHNSKLNGDAYKAYSEWCKEKHILRKNVLRRMCAP